MRSLGKLVAAALGTVAITLVAMPASAALYLASFSGEVIGGTGRDPMGTNPTYDLNNFFGPSNDLVGSKFTAKFRYDTTLYVGQGFTTANVDSRFGGPLSGCAPCFSPILEASITINGKTDHFNTDGAGYANVVINPDGWRQTYFSVGWLSGPFDNRIQLYVLNAPDSVRLASSFSDNNLPQGEPTTLAFASRSEFVPDGTNYRLALSTQGPTGNVTLAPVPEPATWGLMIIGFAVVGAMLRHRRQVLVRA